MSAPSAWSNGHPVSFTPNPRDHLELSVPLWSAEISSSDSANVHSGPAAGAAQRNIEQKLELLKALRSQKLTKQASLLHDGSWGHDVPRS